MRSPLFSCQAMLMCSAIGSIVLKKRRYEPLLLSVTRQADKGMAIEIGLAIVLGVVVQNAHAVEMLAPLSNGRVIHTEQDRLLP